MFVPGVTVCVPKRPNNRRTGKRRKKKEGGKSEVCLLFHFGVVADWSYLKWKRMKEDKDYKKFLPEDVEDDIIQKTSVPKSFIKKVSKAKKGKKAMKGKKSIIKPELEPPHVFL